MANKVSGVDVAGAKVLAAAAIFQGVGPSAALGDHSAGAPQVVQDGAEVVLVGQVDRGRLEGGVLRCPAPPAVCQHVMEQ